MKWTLPNFPNISSTILSRFATFPEIFEHWINTSLKFFIAFPNLIAYFMVGIHSTQFFKLPMEVEYQSDIRRLPGQSGTFGMHSHHIECAPSNTETKVVILRVFAHPMISWLFILILNKL